MVSLLVDRGPYAFRTQLEWWIIGPIGETTAKATVSGKRISVRDITSEIIASQYFAMETDVKDVRIKQMLHRMYALNFNNPCPSRERGLIFQIFCKMGIQIFPIKRERLVK